MADAPTSANNTANTAPIVALPDTTVPAFVVGCAGALVLWLALVSVAVSELLSLLLPDGGGAGDGGGPELDIAFCLKAAAVISPVVGGLTARTIPDLQSFPTEEKNLARSQLL